MLTPLIVRQLIVGHLWNNREEVGKEIVGIALKMNIKGTPALTKKIQEKLPGKTLGQLSNEEMSGILDWFEIELAKISANEKEA